MCISIIRGTVQAFAAALSLATILVSVTLPASAEGAAEEPVERIVVQGEQLGERGTFTATPQRATPNEPDTSQLLQLIPGGDVVDNGALSGQVQYRGMFGDRVNVRIDDVFLSPGGPNWMDAPLHYAPGPILDHLEMDLGIAPVSSGAESIGGSARAVLKRSEFDDKDEFAFSGEIEAGSRTADESFSGGGIISAANEKHRVHLLGSAELGNDYRIGNGGRVKPSDYRRFQYGGGYGVRLGDHELGFDYRYNDTHDTGTPALPMDIAFIETHIAKIDHQAQLGPVNLEALASFNDVDHRMDNFSFRPPPSAGPARWRQNDATSQGGGYSLAADFGLAHGNFELGVDGHLASHDARITNPNNAAFFVVGFNDATKNRYGTWAEWAGGISERWDLELGLRYTRISMDSDEVDGLPAQTLPPAMRLRDAFNAADRMKSDDLVDAVMKVGFEPVSGLRFEVGGGRKTRSASYVERYGWIPTQAAGGLGDGNNYVGDINLDPEVAYEVTAEVEWASDLGTYLAPRAFYRRVDDYIQGTPATNPDVIAVSTGNGDPTPLQFTNVEAELFGIDLAYGASLPCDFQLDGILSYVRGKRVDINDDLYRIAPLRGRTTLTYQQESWSVAVEGVYAASQKNVSVTNGEATSGSWGILNVFGTWEATPRLDFVAGVNNVTDNRYSNHLAGTSRVTNGAAVAGSPLPAAGASFFLRAVGSF